MLTFFVNFFDTALDNVYEWFTSISFGGINLFGFALIFLAISLFGIVLRSFIHKG